MIAVSPVTRTLLSGIVDYAGLFPPASLSMDAAVREYASSRVSTARWMLGRFVAPAARLVEFSDAAATVRGTIPDDKDSWPVTVIATGDPTADAEAMRRLQAAQQGAVRPLLIAGIEIRAASPDEMERVVSPLREFVPEMYVEIPLDVEPEPIVRAIVQAGARAKARTGGTTPDSIPSAASVARFLATCVRLEVPFKLTAGLHHPLRAEYPLTYDSEPERAVMHGFLNAFLAVALLRTGGSEEEATELLQETSRYAITFSDVAISWRHHRFDEIALGDARRLATGFGSCSFAEPVEGLVEMGIA